MGIPGILFLYFFQMIVHIQGSELHEKDPEHCQHRHVQREEEDVDPKEYPHHLNRQDLGVLVPHYQLGC
jgi:hypothetical protein